MAARIFLSDWFGLGLTGLTTLCVVLAVHDNHASSPSEAALVKHSSGLLLAWLTAKGLFLARAGRRTGG